MIIVNTNQCMTFYSPHLKGNSYGNYFDPAKDCSDIMDNVPEAENGVYWIKTNTGPRKVPPL